MDPTEQIPDYAPVQNFNMSLDMGETNQDNYTSTTSFQSMGLKTEIMQAITDCGFEHPSEVQSQVIPKALLGQDILCQAKSGMGKTAVFVITILSQDYILNDFVSALVMCHTRELAQQVEKEFERMKKRLDQTLQKPIDVACFIGGLDINKDIEVLKNRKPNIVIGTPGRLCDLVKRKLLNLEHLKTFVVDECDKMMASSNFNDVGTLFVKSNRDKQVMMFSATISEQNKEYCRHFLRNPIEVFIDDGEKLFLHGLHLFSLELEDTKKIQLLMKILNDIDFYQVIIFADGKNRCNSIVKSLKREKFACGLLHGAMDQDLREKEFNRFRDCESRILVATDLCGRGIDVERVNLVVNFDMPRDSDQFLHRVGRAGRFGTKGVAVSLISNNDDKKVLEEVKNRFSVGIETLPEDLKEIPTSYYK